MNMTLRESIIYSLNEYRNARIKRREAFGPDLVDTIGDIGKATYESARDTAQKTQQSVSYKFQSALNTTVEKANKFWSNTQSKIKQAREFVSEKLNATSNLTHSAADSLRDRIKQYRVGAAIGLDRLSNALNGQNNVEESKRVQSPAKVIQREEFPEIKTDDEKVKFLTPAMKAKFIEYYVRNHETAHRVFEDLDRQQNPEPKLRDYMVRCGFDAFLETVIDAPDMDELRAAAHEDRIRDEELQSFKDLAQQIDQNMLIQNEIIKAHNEKQEVKAVNDSTIKQQQQSVSSDEVQKPVKNPHDTGYNPPAATNPYDASLYDVLPPEFEHPQFDTQHESLLPPDFGHHHDDIPPQFDSQHEPIELTPDDLSEFAEFDELRL